MFIKSKDKYVTDKYPCKRCGERNMIPNVLYGFVKGYKCRKCGTVNYPVRDSFTKK